MAKTSVIDADGHITEKDDQILQYMEEPYRKRSRFRPLYPWDGWDRSLFSTLGTQAYDAQTWLRVMDETGLEAAILYPTSGLFMGFVKDPDYAVALCRAYNTFVHEEFVRVSPRLKAVALLPVQDIPAAVAELNRAVTQLGLVGAMLVADGSHLLGHPRFHPLYEEAQKLNCMLAIHASGSHLGGGGVDLFPRFIQAHTVSHPFGQMRQITSIIFEGVPEKFPQLRLAFLEAGVGWVPYWMNRMDEEYEKRGEVEAPACKKKPSEYITGGRIYFSCEPDEPLLPQVMQLIGEDVLVYASDFPHWDADFPESMRELMEREDLTEEQRRKILSENAKKLYNLNAAQ